MKKKIVKGPKECKNCYGKGYFTVFEGWGGTDEIDGNFFGKPPHVVIKLCTCPRGEEIKFHFTIKPKFK